MGKIILKSLLILITIIICAFIGIAIRNKCSVEYSYLIGWIFGCLSIAICNIVENLLQ